MLAPRAGEDVQHVDRRVRAVARVIQAVEAASRVDGLRYDGGGGVTSSTRG